MDLSQQKSVTLPVGVVIRRTPGVTRWARWIWTPIAVLPGAASADWRVLRQEGDVVEYHAATVPLTLYRGEADAYKIALSQPEPSVYVVLRPVEPKGAWPYTVHLVTASPHEAQLFAESGDEIVGRVTMPPGLLAWVGAYTQAHFAEEPFVKRKRQKHGDRPAQDGIGDPRIAQASDVWRAPTAGRKAGEP